MPETINDSCSHDDLEEILRNQVENWRKKLLDLGNRNSLINCSFHPSRGVLEIVYPNCEEVWQQLAAEVEAGAGTMRLPWRRDLVPPPPDESKANSTSSTIVAKEKEPKEWNPPLEECLNSPHLDENDLLTSIGDKALNRRLRTFDSHARLSLSEQGVHCLYVAFGFLKWYESIDSNVELHSPLMLVPVTLLRNSADAPWELTEAEDDAIDNLCLRQRLKQDFGLELPPLPDIDELEENGVREAFLNSVRAAISKNERWQVEDRCALGRFAFPKVAMWKDLGDHVDGVISHPLCRSIGGDTSVAPSNAFGSLETLPEAKQLDDQIPPGEIKAILDCDSSQMEAIVAARQSVSFVLDGPPGTGKSQTIANIISDALSEGRKVLFVSEKISALEVVKRRLDDCGLGDFCLECHSSKANRKAVLDELEWCLELPEETYDDATPKIDELSQKRDALNAYVRAVHLPRSPLGISAYDLYGHISRFARLGYVGKSRCTMPDPTIVDQATINYWLQMLDQAKDLTEVIQRYESHPWRACLLKSRSLSLEDDVRQNCDSLTEAFQQIEMATRPLIDDGLLSKEITPSTLNETLRELIEALKVPEIPRSWFDHPQDVADTVLSLLKETTQLTELRSSLIDYIDNIAECFPDVAAEAISDPDSCPWIRQLTTLPPNGLRSQLDLMRSLATRLQELVNRITAAESTLPRLIEQIGLPIKSQLPISAIPKLIGMAQLILECGTMRPGWFDPTNWTRLRQVSLSVLEKIDESAQVASQISARVPANHLLQVAQQVDSLDSLENAAKTLRTYRLSGTLDELNLLIQNSERALSALESVLQSVKEITSQLGVSDQYQPTLKSAKSILEFVKSVSEAGIIHGGWQDTVGRNRLRQSCDDAMADLVEADDIRDRLQGHLSHRAFKTTGADLACRGVAFQSFWNRWFGGLRAFRRDAVELYRDAVPSNASLLADCVQINLFHKRKQSALDTADELVALLPMQFTPDDASAWKRIQNAIKDFESLLNSAPDLAAAFPTKAIEFERNSMLMAHESGHAALLDLEQILQDSELQSLISPQRKLEELAGELQQIKSAAEVYRNELQKTFGIFSSSPSSLTDLIDDLKQARRYALLHNAIQEVFTQEESLMPYGTLAQDRSTWEKVLSGIEAAERLSSMSRVPEVLRDAFCSDGQIDATSLRIAVDEMKSAYSRFDSALSEIEQDVVISHPDDTILESRRQSLTSLRQIIEVPVQQFELRAHHLSQLVAVLTPNADMDLNRLPTDLLLICDFQDISKRLYQSERDLQSLCPIENPQLPAQAEKAATWLRTMSASDTITKLHQAIASDSSQRLRVQRIVQGIKQACQAKFKDSWNFLRSLFDIKAPSSTNRPIIDTPVGFLAKQLSLLGDSTSQLDEWLKFSRWKLEMNEHGLGEIAFELLEKKYSPLEAKDVIACRIYRQLFDHLGSQDSNLLEFDLQSHEKALERFRQLDKWEIKAAATRIRQFQLGRDDRPRIGWQTAGTSELGILQREIQKKRRHMPLRKLFAEIPGILQALKPCIMMSPLSVSTFLESEELRFDLVIFDEASQVFPWDSIGAIYRGDQLIVAGDEKQLPPTNFFNRGDIESEDDEDDIGDFESILSLCKSINMPHKCLRWHYRSRREPLIAFSNRHFYDGSLVTFPSVRDASGDSVRLELVAQGRWIDRKNQVEAERVADLVIKHLRSNLHTSLGVIAFNSSQQMAIEDTIYERRRSNPEIDALFQATSDEPLFIKNLENVQGDERDVILLSMGYAYNESGKFLKNFGPLTKSGGERRLNVAVTRAREKLILVASVRAADMDLSGSTSQGSHLLKAYLEYAERGIDSLGRTTREIASECESPFEEEVASALIRHGIEPVPQVGCGGFRIDLGLKHPDRPGEFCLGIECDGATYHSSHTARDRDRLRQTVLEGLGWSIVRIWSTDWIRSPQKQLDRILVAFKSAASRYDNKAIDQSQRNGEQEPEIDGLMPIFLQESQSTPVIFSRIEDVPEDVVIEKALLILKRSGATDRNDLIKLVARELGFERTGRKIRDRVDEALNRELRAGSVRQVGERVALQIRST